MRNSDSPAHILTLTVVAHGREWSRHSPASHESNELSPTSTDSAMEVFQTPLKDRLATDCLSRQASAERGPEGDAVVSAKLLKILFRVLKETEAYHS